MEKKIKKLVRERLKKSRRSSRHRSIRHGAYVYHPSHRSVLHSLGFLKYPRPSRSSVCEVLRSMGAEPTSYDVYAGDVLTELGLTFTGSGALDVLLSAVRANVLGSEALGDLVGASYGTDLYGDVAGDALADAVDLGGGIYFCNRRRRNFRLCPRTGRRVYLRL